MHTSAYMTMTTRRTTLRTRPRIQRALIRSWEYIPAIRITFLVIRLLLVAWLAFVATVLLSISNWLGLPIIALAFLVPPLSLWIFTTAAKGWPAPTHDPQRP